MKKICLALITLTLVLAACSGAATPMEAPAEPEMEMAESFGGGFDEGFAADFERVEDQKAANMADSTTSGAIQRMVIKNANLSIVVNDPIKKSDEIAKMADEMGGFVVESNVWQNTLSSGAKVHHASITIRVPAGRLDEALDRIKTGVGEITSEDVSGQDVTLDYTDLQSRLRNLEATEAQLQEIMDEARDTEDVLQVYNNLVNVREQIEVIKGQMQYYEQAAALSVIRVDITGDEEAQPLQIGGWRPVGVAKNAIEAMIQTVQFLGNVAIWLVLYLLPVGIVAGIPLYFLGRFIRRLRRRRKAERAAEKDLEVPQEDE